MVRIILLCLTLFLRCVLPLRRIATESRMAPAAFYGWTSPDLPKELTVDCFLPTGVLVPLQCKVSATLAEIKTKLFETAQNYPLFTRLEGESNYCFLCINEKGKREMLLDESLKLTDVKPFRPVLKLLERQGDDKGDSKLDAKIKFLMRQTPAELEGKENKEVINFRQVYLKFALDESRERRKSSWEERAASTYPSDVCTDPVPEYVSKNLRNGKFDLIVYLPPGDDVERLEIPTGTNPSDVVYIFRSRSEKRRQLIATGKDYVLKIVGKDEFLLGNFNLENYQVCISLVYISLLLLV